jgi:hypothetical protein
MDNLSMNQALSIWDDLWQAYYGDNGFGSDTAEIYAYRLMQYNPVVHCFINKEFQDTELYRERNSDVCDRAQKSLIELLKKFKSENDCIIKVNGKEIDDWIKTEVFDHRVHVKVIHKEEK